MVTELVWDGQCREAVEEQGHLGHVPQHVGDGAHIEDLCQ